MKIEIVRTEPRKSLSPISDTIALGDFPISGIPLSELLHLRISQSGLPASSSISVREDFWPSDSLIQKLSSGDGSFRIVYGDSEVLMTFSYENSGKKSADISPDEKSVIVRHPWDLLRINEMVVGEIGENLVEGEIRPGATIDGHIRLGSGSVILPGTYIEGNAVIGRNCKIGPNCYIRGATSIGDGCHIGQAVEIKNSIIMEDVGIGHLSYVGDSIICRGTNFGAGTITANFRHDGKNHRSLVEGVLVDTGRRKLGAIIGEGVHTGIHTSIYPGRKIWPGMSTLPGGVISKDIVKS